MDTSKSSLALNDQISENSVVCPARDAHCSHFDEETRTLYVFGGYVNGNKTNDLWKYDMVIEKWNCIDANGKPH